jgi:hypothetical protein
VGHLCPLIEAGEDIEWRELVPSEQYTRIVAAMEQGGDTAVGSLKNLLGTEVSYNAIRLARAVYRRELEEKRST